MSKDLYAVLGVNKASTRAEIKSAYHKLARKCHPDVNKDNPAAAERFKEISSAYDVLGDEEKRKKYDNKEIDADGKPTGFGAGGFGDASQYSGQGAEGFDFSSIFGEDIFSAFSSGGGRGGFSGQRRRQKGEDIAYTMKIDFLSAVRGSEQQVNIAAKPINVKIPAGSADGQTLRLKGLGKPGHFGGESGDVLITLNVEKHPYFSLDGINIILELPISVKEAILGGKVTVPTIDGKVAVKIPAYASSGDKLRLKGKGVNNHKGSGDQIMVLKIIAPSVHDECLENALQSISDEDVRNF